jgi:hypothetical protein
MDENVVGRITRQELEPVSDRLGARSTARRDHNPGMGGEAVEVVGMQHDEDAVDPVGIQKGVKRPVDDTAAQKGLPLLGAVPACAGAPSCGDDEGGGCHGT